MAWVKTWMGDSCKFCVLPNDAKVLSALPELTKYIHDLQSAGKLLLDILFKFASWPTLYICCLAQVHCGRH